MQALQREADELAQRSRTLLGELRALEIDRDLKAEQLRQLDTDLAAASAWLLETDGRIAALERRRLAQQPGLAAEMVDIYKRGHAGYLRLLLGVSDLRDLGRAARAVSALARMDRQRVDEYRRTLAALRAQRDELDRRNQQLTALRLESRRAQIALQRSIAAGAALVAGIDRRRDLTAQLAGELQVAQQQLQQTVTALATPDPGVVPLAPFRGDLDWPANGRVVSRFGRDASGRFGESGRSGIDIATPEGTPVRAVHPGTVGFAEPFTGFGNLVVVDHGHNAFTVYGYLASLAVSRGQRVDAGDELGVSGTAPAGPAALYFEVRVDGRPTDPVQWLKPR